MFFPPILAIRAERFSLLITSTIVRISDLSPPAQRKPSSIGVIDIFSGPGGLGEGFSSFQPKKGVNPFEIVVSAEMERTAHATLRLRSFVRRLRKDEGPLPVAYAKYLADVVAGTAVAPEEHFGTGAYSELWKMAESEALNLTLGVKKDNDALFEKLDSAKKKYDSLVLIGGPPCQAYSLVGRARQTNVPGFHTKGDAKHFLYREYLKVLARYTPDVFIMENVKGILSSTVNGRNMFQRIRADLVNPKRAMGGSASADSEYVLLPVHIGADETRDPEAVLSDPSGFIVRCEAHGIPQARHRVIIMGVKASLLDKAVRAPGLEVPNQRESVEAALSGLPALRSGLSRRPDDASEWLKTMLGQRKLVASALARKSDEFLKRVVEGISFDEKLKRRATTYSGHSKGVGSKLRHPELATVTGHETRGHMASDFGRYLFASAFASANKRSPASSDFPKRLAPDHLNWETGDFADRFRVQQRENPGSTVTSHLSKDGHAFIHWDPGQCRSLTVREAARIQTFPDDYLFLGNRTEQFVQVGNAVPPLLARQIANVVHSIISGQQAS